MGMGHILRGLSTLFRAEPDFGELRKTVQREEKNARATTVKQGAGLEASLRALTQRVNSRMNGSEVDPATPKLGELRHASMSGTSTTIGVQPASDISSDFSIRGPSTPLRSSADL